MIKEGINYASENSKKLKNKTAAKFNVGCSSSGLYIMSNKKLLFLFF